MTLDTHVYVLDKVDVHELFREAQRLLGLADDGGQVYGGAYRCGHGGAS